MDNIEKITQEEAIEKVKLNVNLPQAIHMKIMANFKNNNRLGILSYIAFEKPIIKEVKIDDVEYFEVAFEWVDISWQEINPESLEIDIFFDGEAEGENGVELTKSLINKNTGEFKYIGNCRYAEKDIGHNYESEEDDEKNMVGGKFLAIYILKTIAKIIVAILIIATILFYTFTFLRGLIK